MAKNKFVFHPRTKDGYYLEDFQNDENEMVETWLIEKRGIKITFKHIVKSVSFEDYQNEDDPESDEIDSGE